MHRQLACHMPRGRRMPREVAQHGVYVAKMRGPPAIALAQHRLGTRLRHVLAKMPPGPGMQRQPGQELRQFTHIPLGIWAARAERVQFQHLPRKVLVQATAAGLLRHPVRPRPGRCVLVEVMHHQRMRHRRDQQVLEPPRDVRTDGTFHVGRRGVAQDTALAHGGEVIRPEPFQPLAKARRRVDTPRDMRREPPVMILAGRLPVKLDRLARLGDGAGLAGSTPLRTQHVSLYHPAQKGLERLHRKPRRHRVGALDPRQKGLGAVGRRDGRGKAASEADLGEDGIELHRRRFLQALSPHYSRPARRWHRLCEGGNAAGEKPPEGNRPIHDRVSGPGSSGEWT